jgi:DNA ligase (NAD+)
MDGMVASVLDSKVQKHMGATTHHHRWQVAIKSKGQTATSTVRNIKWQVGRTGNITPVLEIEPVSLSGATIQRVTGHHAGLILKNKVGIGSVIEVIRSGEVIPKIEKIIKSAEAVVIPDHCPECHTPLTWNNDFLKCSNQHCRAQIIQGIHHWFKTLGNADWFGIKTIEKLVNHHFDDLESIYDLSEKALLDMGFGPVQAKNLVEALAVSIRKPVEDWRFLAAFGISNLGKGDSRKLLSHMAMEQILGATPQDIERIHGFGTLTSRAIAEDIAKLKSTIQHMLNKGFQIEKTPQKGDEGLPASPIAGKKIVFTGKMKHGNRELMKSEAAKLGADVQTGVTGKTDFLVCGEKVGISKTDKARKLGVRILSETDYRQLLNA